MHSNILENGKIFIIAHGQSTLNGVRFLPCYCHQLFSLPWYYSRNGHTRVVTIVILCCISDLTQKSSRQNEEKKILAYIWHTLRRNLRVLWRNEIVATRSSQCSTFLEKVAKNWVLFASKHKSSHTLIEIFIRFIQSGFRLQDWIQNSPTFSYFIGNNC